MSRSSRLGKSGASKRKLAQLPPKTRSIPHATFRKWLIDRLLGTSYVAAFKNEPEEVQRTAYRLGIRTDVLLEAREQACLIRDAEGLQRPMGRKRAGSAHYQYTINMPRYLNELWKAECDRRGIKGSALLRSMIHAYLRGSWEPEHLCEQWVYHGIIYPDARTEAAYREKRRCNAYRERTLIPNGAKRALGRRSWRLGFAPTSLVRALIVHVLEGKWGGPGTFPIVDSAAMFDDETRYFLG